MARAKVFMPGRSRAIRLPKEFRVEGKEAYLRKVPEDFLLTERDPWEIFREGCEELSHDFMAHRKPLPLQQQDWSK